MVSMVSNPMRPRARFTEGNGGRGTSCAYFFVERVAFGKRDHRGILARRAQRSLLHQRFGIAARKVGEIANFYGPFGRVDVGDCRGLGDAR